MRALNYQDHGLVLERDYPRPTPVEGEALIRVTQAGICNTDLEIVQGYMGFHGVLGHEFVGVVEEIYGEITLDQYNALYGKRVVGEINAACNRYTCYYCRNGMPTHCPQRTTLGIDKRDGAFADYVQLPIENLHVVPDTVSDDEAIFVEPLAANFEILEQVHLRPTETVLVLGDGKMGQLAAQVLALNGEKVIMVGKHKEKLALASQQGINTCLLTDPETFASPFGRRADVVIECTGSEQGLQMALRLVRPRGTVILKSTVAATSNLHLAPIVIDEIRVQGSRCGPFPPALQALKRKMVNVKPLISARYSFDQALEAFEHAKQPGTLKVVLTM
ncbi:threonine dehydrogenase-like Zn-dependent dehydrogenase [Thermosporothrix hazakensis]|jgi:threonine dehydrogenase-like Zn-dependent dehydrogenase|uniref:Threonine dehydrogenase-like Zn-dependent dehydrogenase n=2 Tax=Thermosporothrix TaxID=768650 RepID=A0A326TPF7_THEHA|nr:alcohol dehydrogenase catalytic domain-containing protein [Thermosporothrix hazakensis]PZW18240.1 threonine dehydrogenase-like Zn-dependent dehydrogenase [Thermosporothrix hazakensis]BBH90558.1 alcohol dehydrogenase [Thermosporothrix sp. COM3]GCE48611.1 alcohol dehydrogenase [Thermosporothrix hazakensis]